MNVSLPALAAGLVALVLLIGAWMSFYVVRPDQFVVLTQFGEPIDEIFLGKEGQAGPGLILMKYVDRPAPENGELLLVFTTDDIDALVDSVRAAGGGVYVEPFQSDVTPYRAAFTTDPEGHLIENVELTQA